MKNKSIVTALVVLMFPLISSAQNLLTNPDFSGLGTDWGSFGDAGFNEFFGPGFGPHASFFADGPPDKSGGVFDLNISGTAGTEYEFFLNSVNIESNFDGTLTIALEFFEVDNTTKISEVTQLLNLTSATGGGLGFDLSGQTVSGIAPVNTGFVRPLISFDGGLDDGGSDNAFVSTATMQVIPEPSTLTLILIAIAGVVGMRRLSLNRD